MDTAPRGPPPPTNSSRKSCSTPGLDVVGCEQLQAPLSKIAGISSLLRRAAHVKLQATALPIGPQPLRECTVTSQSSGEIEQDGPSEAAYDTIQYSSPCPGVHLPSTHHPPPTSLQPPACGLSLRGCRLVRVRVRVRATELDRGTPDHGMALVHNSVEFCFAFHAALKICTQLCSDVASNTPALSPVLLRLQGHDRAASHTLIDTDRLMSTLDASHVPSRHHHSVFNIRGPGILSTPPGALPPYWVA